MLGAKKVLLRFCIQPQVVFLMQWGREVLMIYSEMYCVVNTKFD